MRSRHLPALAVVAALLVAGCVGPFGGPDNRSTATSPRGSSPTPTPGTPTPSTPTANDSLPPGVDETGVTNASALLAAHTAALTDDGFVATGHGNTTILRNGFYLSTSWDGRTRVEPNATGYYEVNDIDAGPVTRERELWANNTTAYRRIDEAGSITYRKRRPRPPEALASTKLLRPFIEGGDYALVATNETANVTRHRFRATTVGNASALLDGLPAEAESIRWIDATLVVDRLGRIRSFAADVGFVIGTRNETHRLRYDVVRTGNVSVPRPDWLAEAIASTGDGGGSALPAPGPADGAGALTAAALSSRRAGVARSPPRRRPKATAAPPSRRSGPSRGPPARRYR